MIDRFKHIDLDNEKVHRIINCGFKEFGSQSYEKASTNEIVKNACVSRGLLYHYFKDKKDLYEFLIYYSINLFIEQLENKIQWTETDFLNRMRQTIFLKCLILEKYPYLMEFYKEIKLEKINEYYMLFGIQSTNLKDKLYNSNIDFSVLKKGTDINKFTNLTLFVVKQIANNHIELSQNNNTRIDKQALLKEVDEYLEFIRMNFYS